MGTGAARAAAGAAASLAGAEEPDAGAYYINCLAVLPAFRRRGVAGALLGEAERRAEGAAGLCLVVADRNADARRLYEAFGFAEAGREPMVKDGWASESESWVLMVKPVV